MAYIDNEPTCNTNQSDIVSIMNSGANTMLRCCVGYADRFILYQAVYLSKNIKGKSEGKFVPVLN
jgi:hypothetical protein